eukprot:6402336-Amphidinium_carterae.1
MPQGPDRTSDLSATSLHWRAIITRKRQEGPTPQGLLSCRQPRCIDPRQRSAVCTHFPDRGT